MKPGFALSLSDDRIDLLQRTDDGWAHVGAADPAAADFDESLGRLRDKAMELSPQGVQTKLILPGDQILYADVLAPGPDRGSRRAQIAKALEGRTPYRVEDLVYDWSGTGDTVQVAVVARLTLDEAEAFAAAAGFAPVSFVASPEPGRFAGEPYFGPTRDQAANLPTGVRLDRDQDPVPLAFGQAPAAAPIADLSSEDPGPDEDTDTGDQQGDGGTWVSQSPVDEADFIDVADEDYPPVEPSIEREDAAEGPAGPGFVSYRPAGRAPDNDSQLENLSARIRVGGSAPVADSAAELISPLPDRDDALDIEVIDEVETADSAAPDTSGLRPIESLLPALERARNPALAPRPKPGATAARRRVLAVAGAAAGAFAGLVLLWWIWFSVADPASVAVTTQTETPQTELPAAKTPSLAETQVDAAAPQPSETLAEAPTEALAEDPHEPALATVDQTGSPETQPETRSAAEPAPQPAGPNDAPPAPPAILALAGTEPAPDADAGRPSLAPEAPVEATQPLGLAQSANADPLLPDPGLPTPFDGLVRFDPEGQIIPTPEGVRTPDGIFLYSGTPPDNPGARPRALAAVPPDPVAVEEPPIADTPEPLPPPDPQTSGLAPIARPASVSPAAPADSAPLDLLPAPGDEPLGAPTPTPDTDQQVDDQALATPLPPDPATGASQPKARPAAIASAAETAAAAAADEPAAVQTSSRYAIVTSLRPTARPDGTSRAVEAALAAALAEPEAAPATAAAADVTASVEEIDEPEPESAAPDIPTKANVAREATVKNGIDLGDLSLIGITGSPASRLALVRTAHGKILRVKVGDRLDGGKVAAIGESELSYVKKGKTYILKMTSKG